MCHPDSEFVPDFEFKPTPEAGQPEASETFSDAKGSFEFELNPEELDGASGNVVKNVSKTAVRTGRNILITGGSGENNESIADRIAKIAETNGVPKDQIKQVKGVTPAIKLESE